MRDNPNLSPKQIDRIRSVALLRSVRAGEVLYEPSQPDVPLFIVLAGNVSISRTGEDDKILAVREANQFTGEMSVIFWEAIIAPGTRHCGRQCSGTQSG
jgi:thioredoxin reductase (NADPH)